MSSELNGKRIAILVENGFEQVEMTEPRQALEDAGAQADLISPEDQEVMGMEHEEPGDSFTVDVSLKSANPDNYDGLMLPGGVANPDKLRMNPDAVKFVKSFVDAGKPIAAICHGPWTLIEAGAAKGRTMTSWPSLKTDLRNAGANWVDKEVVVDRGVVTSRKPDDIPAFNEKMIEEFREGNHGPGLSQRHEEAKR
jgi:protease I